MVCGKMLVSRLDNLPRRPRRAHDRRTRRCASSGGGPVGWLVFDRPDVGNAMDARMMRELERAWRELDDDPDVRVIVNTGAGDGVPDRARHGAARPRSRGAARAVAPHQAVRAALHRVAQRRVEAGDRGRQRCVRGRRSALRRRRRHRDRVRERDASSTRTCRSARRRVYETIALAKKSPMEAVLRMAFVGRHERIDRAAGVRARHLLAGRRPAGAAARQWRRQLGELIARNRRAARARRSARCGARWNACRDASPTYRAPRSSRTSSPHPGHARRVQPLVRDAITSRRRCSAVRACSRARASSRRARARQLRPPGGRCSATRPAVRTSRSRGSLPGHAGRVGRVGGRARWRRSPPQGRLFPHREHVHTAVYRARGTRAR